MISKKYLHQLTKKYYKGNEDFLNLLRDGKENDFISVNMVDIRDLLSCNNDITDTNKSPNILTMKNIQYESMSGEINTATFKKENPKERREFIKHYYKLFRLVCLHGDTEAIETLFKCSPISNIINLQTKKRKDNLSCQTILHKVVEKFLAKSCLKAYSSCKQKAREKYLRFIGNNFIKTIETLKCLANLDGDPFILDSVNKSIIDYIIFAEHKQYNFYPVEKLTLLQALSVFSKKDEIIQKHISEISKDSHMDSRKDFHIDLNLLFLDACKKLSQNLLTKLLLLDEVKINYFNEKTKNTGMHLILDAKGSFDKKCNLLSILARLGGNVYAQDIKGQTLIDKVFHTQDMSVLEKALLLNKLFIPGNTIKSAEAFFKKYNSISAVMKNPFIMGNKASQIESHLQNSHNFTSISDVFNFSQTSKVKCYRDTIEIYFGFSDIQPEHKGDYEKIINGFKNAPIKNRIYSMHVVGSHNTNLLRFPQIFMPYVLDNNIPHPKSILIVGGGYLQAFIKGRSEYENYGFFCNIQKIFRMTFSPQITLFRCCFPDAKIYVVDPCTVNIDLVNGKYQNQTYYPKTYKMLNRFIDAICKVNKGLFNDMFGEFVIKLKKIIKDAYTNNVFNNKIYSFLGTLEDFYKHKSYKEKFDLICATKSVVYSLTDNPLLARAMVLHFFNLLANNGVVFLDDQTHISFLSDFASKEFINYFFKNIEELKQPCHKISTYKDILQTAKGQYCVQRGQMNIEEYASKAYKQIEYKQVTPCKRYMIHWDKIINVMLDAKYSDDNLNADKIPNGMSFSNVFKYTKSI